MRTTTNILASIIVFTTAAAANAQDFRSLFTPFQTQYGVTQTNYQAAQPYRTNTNCRNGNCSQRTNSPYASTASYGLPQACVNGQCNHPQHRYGMSTVSNTRYGQSATYPNGQYSSCPNGQCGNGQCTSGQCRNGQCGNTRPYNGITGVSTIPFNQTSPVNYGATTPYNNSVINRRPTYGTQSYGSATSSPYYN